MVLQTAMRMPAGVTRSAVTAIARADLNGPAAPAAGVAIVTAKRVLPAVTGTAKNLANLVNIVTAALAPVLKAVKGNLVDLESRWDHRRPLVVGNL